MTQQTFDETKHPRGDGGKFATKPAGESETDLGDYDRATPPGHYTGKPFNASVQPQAWVNDDAMDVGPEVDFDIARALHAMDADSREMLLFDVESGMAADHDHLYFDAADRSDVERGYGPFAVRLDADTLREWLEDNPPWVQDGTTPHPTGGYVTVEDLSTDREQVWDYRDADGKRHNADGPAFVKEDDTGVMERYYKHGVLHNDNGPAQVIRGITGESRTWYVDGQEVASQVESTTPGWEIVDGKPVRSD